MAASDPYLYSGTNVLRNLLNIRTADQLATYERDVTEVRIAELKTIPIPGKFDLNHLKAIHRHIFQDVYGWAGEVRTVDIAKGGHLFASNHFVDSAGTKLFDQLAGGNHLRGLDANDFAQRAGHYLGEINALHPFREGNGRTQRAFMQALGEQAGHELYWKGINQAEMTAASIESHSGGNSQMSALIHKAMIPSHERAL